MYKYFVLTMVVFIIIYLIYKNIKKNSTKKAPTNISNDNLKVFDLSQNYPEFIKGELQQNLDKFAKMFGEEFKVKYNDKSFIANLIKVKSPGGLEFYQIVYNPPHRTTVMRPITLNFADITTYEINNNTYISEIQKTNEFSGTELVDICIKINKILGAKKIFLTDTSSIYCEKYDGFIDLSSMKLIENGVTFYMKNGFDFDLKMNYRWITGAYFNKDSLKKEINNIINNIHKVKTQDIIDECTDAIKLIKEYNLNNSILNNSLKTYDTQNLEIRVDLIGLVYDDFYYIEKPKNSIDTIFEENINVLNILNKYKREEYLYKILVNLFTVSCKECANILDYLFVPYTIKYGTKMVSRKYARYFTYLYFYRDAYLFSYNIE